MDILDILQVARQIGEFKIEMNHMGDISMYFDNEHEVHGNVDNLPVLMGGLERVIDETPISIMEISRMIDAILEFHDHDEPESMLDALYSLDSRVKATILGLERLEFQEKVRENEKARKNNNDNPNL